MGKHLETLKKVPISEIWKNEERDFKTWMSDQGNLDFFSEELYLPLSLEETEKRVGPFEADLLASTSNFNCGTKNGGKSMGTTGSGRFPDYPGSKPRNGSTGGPNGPGNEGRNQCDETLIGVDLEEVARCPYYVRTKAVPPHGLPVRVRNELYKGRVAVETIDAGEVIGLLPTHYNYLVACLAVGYQYEGVIVSSSSKPIPVIKVDLKAAK